MSPIYGDQPNKIIIDASDANKVIIASPGTQGATGPQGATGATGPGVAAGGTTGQILIKVDNQNYNTTWADQTSIATSTVKHLVKNDAGVVLPKGTVVYTSGANGTNILVRKALATTDLVSSQVLGFLESELGINQSGYCINNGLVTNINTQGTAAGDPVWLSPTIAGGFVTGIVNKPHAPNHLVYLGVITRANANTGEIFVHISNGWELDELHNVDVITTAPSNNDLLVYENSTSLWKNKSLSAIGGVTSVAGTSPISSSGGSTPNISIDQTAIYAGNLWTNPNDYVLDFGGSANPQSILGSPTRGFTLVAGRTYEIECDFQVGYSYVTNTTATLTFQWNITTQSGSPTSTVGIFNQFTNSTTQTGAASVTAARYDGTGGGNTLTAAVNSTTPNRYAVVRSKGQVRVSGTGTMKIFPGIRASGITDNVVVVYKNLYFKITDVGTDSVTNLGTWTA